KYLSELNKEQLEEQIIELYEKFSPVKVYYNFVFNPKEESLLQECKLKISNEYYPLKKLGRRSKPKMRRSVAQKYIKHFTLLGVDPFVIADVMLYNIEIAQTFSSEHVIKQDLFFKSMFNSFEQAVTFLIANGILNDFKPRIISIHKETMEQKWRNEPEFNATIERFEY
ncbi:MAG TPA: DUF6155 family protein, partial [Flavobacterium sp.]|uniref:DUF6155 family protein n=1 Tax=Flavobacterium sp. TaxID=239 RepID=UPI002C213745